MKRIAQDPTAERTRAKAWFVDNGVAIARWAKDHGFSRQNVLDVLNGKNKGLRGQGHEIAVQLGIKPEPKKVSLRRAA